MAIKKDILVNSARELVSKLHLVNNNKDKVLIEVNPNDSLENLSKFILEAGEFVKPTDHVSEETISLIEQLKYPTEDMFEDELATHNFSGVEKPPRIGSLSGIIDKNTIPISEIEIKEPFKSLFSINSNTLSSITASMEVNGFDPAHPVILWGNIMIDGHTRLAAASDVGITDIPFERKSFNNEKEALEYAIHNQRDRRNISDSEMLICIEVLDSKMTKAMAGKKGGKSNGKEKNTPTHERTAKILGIGNSKVSDARIVLNEPSAKSEVLSGHKSISMAAKEIRSRKYPKEISYNENKNRYNILARTITENFSSQIVSVLELAQILDTLYMKAGGKSSMKNAIEVTNHVVNTLVAFNLATKITEDEIRLSDLKSR